MVTALFIHGDKHMESESKVAGLLLKLNQHVTYRSSTGPTAWKSLLLGWVSCVSSDAAYPKPPEPSLPRIIEFNRPESYETKDGD